MTINQVWENLDAGKTICWSNTGYTVIVETAIKDSEFQANHHTFRDGKVLSVRFTDNYFGGLMDEKELDSLFMVETADQIKFNKCFKKGM